MFRLDESQNTSTAATSGQTKPAKEFKLGDTFYQMVNNYQSH